MICALNPVFSAAEDIELVTAERPALVAAVAAVAVGCVAGNTVDGVVTGCAIYKPPIKVVENSYANFWAFF